MQVVEVSVWMLFVCLFVCLFSTLQVNIRDPSDLTTILNGANVAMEDLVGVQVLVC